MVKNCLQCRRPQFDSWAGKILWRKDRLPTPVFLGFPCASAGKESACNAEDLGSMLGWKDPWRRKRLPTPVFLGFPCASAVKESTCNAEDLGLIPGLGRSPGERKGYPLQYSGRENSMDCIVHEVAKSQTQLSDFHFLSGNKIMNATWHSQNNTKKDILGDARRLWR